MKKPAKKAPPKRKAKKRLSMLDEHGGRLAALEGVQLNFQSRMRYLDTAYQPLRNAMNMTTERLDAAIKVIERRVSALEYEVGFRDRQHQELIKLHQEAVRRLAVLEQRGFRAWLSRQWAAFRRPLAFVKDRK